MIPPPPASTTGQRSATVAVVGVAGGVGVSSLAAALRDRVAASVSVLDGGGCSSCWPDLVGSRVVVVTRPDLLCEALALEIPARLVVVSQVTPRRMSRADAWAVRASGALMLPYAVGGRPLESRQWWRAVDRLADQIGH